MTFQGGSTRTGWIDMSPWSPFTAGQTVQACRINGIVYIRGWVNTNGAASGGVVFQLDAGFRPSAQWRYVNDTAPVATSSGRISVETDGRVLAYTKTGTPTTFFLSTSFPADQ